MAYFNHAFCKTFIATAADQTALNPGVVAPGNLAGIDAGILTSTGIHVSELKNTGAGFGLGPGVTGFFGRDNLSLDVSGATCPFYIASAAIKINDKQGPYHGGYQESNKSKIVNPRYLRRIWQQTANGASRAILELGATPDQTCDKTFLCGEDYNLRIEVKGSDALRFANHNLYQTLQANGGCCPDINPTAEVNPAVIYLQWARQIAGTEVFKTGNTVPGSDVGNAYLKDFIRPVIIADGLSYFFSDEIASEELGAPTTGRTFDDLEALIVDETNPATVGMVLLGAYAETTFGDCTFTPSDYYSVEPIQLYASEVDLNGDPCTFEGLCVGRTCEGIQANGLGESVARDIILHESYLTNFMHSDLRIREITQGTDLWNVIDRTARYDRTYIQHSVPRYNNPSGVFDNDQYVLEIIQPEGTSATLAADLDAFLIANGNTCDPVETIGSTACDLGTSLA